MPNSLRAEIFKFKEGDMGWSTAVDMKTFHEALANMSDKQLRAFSHSTLSMKRGGEAPNPEESEKEYQDLVEERRKARNDMHAKKGGVI